jgi:TPR repeat protein
MKRTAMLASVLGALLTACGASMPQGASEPPGCQHDKQCKGDRICDRQACVAPARPAQPPAAAGPVAGKPEGETASAEAAGASAAPSTCEYNNPAGCYALGMELAFGSGGAVDEPGARASFQKACQGGHVYGCVMLGILLQSKGNEKYCRVLDVELQRKACDKGEGEACIQLGRLLDHSFALDVTRDDAAARRAYEAACDDDQALGCTSAARMWSKGQGGPRDKAKARQFMKRACDLGIEYACKSSE